MHDSRAGAAGTEPVARYRRWSWVLVLVAGAVLYEAARWAVELTSDPKLVPTLILLGAVVVPAAVVTFLWGRQPVPGLGGRVVALTAVLGGAVGVVVAATLEYVTHRALGTLAWITVGLIEEGAKLLVPAAALVVLRGDRRPADGLLLGVASGAGFAVLETMGYGLVALVRSGGHLGAVNGVLIDRGLLSPAAHLAWTGVAAFALWRAATDSWRPAAVTRFVGVYLVVALLHAGWDGAQQRWPDVVVAVISLGLLTWTVHGLARPRPCPPVVVPAATAPASRHPLSPPPAARDGASGSGAASVGSE